MTGGAKARSLRFVVSSGLQSPEAWLDRCSFSFFCHSIASNPYYCHTALANSILFICADALLALIESLELSQSTSSTLAQLDAFHPQTSSKALTQIWRRNFAKNNLKKSEGD